jgi:lipopolysaccharide export LptBFGC system permease protein LptF
MSKLENIARTAAALPVIAATLSGATDTPDIDQQARENLTEQHTKQLHGREPGEFGYLRQGDGDVRPYASLAQDRTSVDDNVVLADVDEDNYLETVTADENGTINDRPDVYEPRRTTDGDVVVDKLNLDMYDAAQSFMENYDN